MIVYLANGVVSAIALYLAIIDREHGAKFLSLFCLAAAILVPCTIAGIRGDSVGTDIATYGTTIYAEAKSFSLVTYSTINPTFTLLFNIVSWTCARISPTIVVFLLLIQFCSVAPVAIALFTAKDNKYAPLAYYAYQMTFFMISLNAIRQGVSVALALVSILLLVTNRKKGSFIACLFAWMFHSSGVICLLIYPLYYLLKKNSDRSLALIAYYAVAMLLVFGFPVFDDAVSLFVGGYSRYLSDSQSSLFGTSIFACLSFALIGVFGLAKSGGDLRLRYSAHLVLLGALQYLLAVYSASLYRVALYFLAAAIVLILWLPESEGVDRRRSLSRNVNERGSCYSDQSSLRESCRSQEQKLTVGFLVIWVTAFSSIYFGYFGLHEVVPFVMRLT